MPAFILSTFHNARCKNRQTCPQVSPDVLSSQNQQEISYYVLIKALPLCFPDI